MQCPKCNSDNTQRLEVIYEQGTQNIASTNHSGSSDSSRFGVSQSKLAQKVSPPKGESWGFFIILVVIGLLCLGFSSIGVKIFGLLLVAGGIYGIYSAIKFNLKEYPDLYQYWKKSWYCNKCGNIYHEVESQLENYKSD